jgi:hypothetical protein
MSIPENALPGIVQPQGGSGQLSFAFPGEAQAATPQETAGASAQGLASQVQEAILQSILNTLSRTTELNVDIMANAVNTLAAAYKSLGAEQQGISPQDQLALEQQKLQMEHIKMEQEMDIEAQKFELEKAKAMLDMHTKKSQADQDAQHKEQAHQQTLSLNERRAEQEAATAGIKANLQVQESNAKTEALRSKPEPKGEASS